MYIAVLSAKRKWSKKEYFDQLNNFYLKHRETINKDKTALMSWRAVENNGHWTINKNSATDGDLFIAQALLLASKHRADVIVGGLIPISLVLRNLQVSEVIFSNCGLRDGILFEYLRKNRKE